MPKYIIIIKGTDINIPSADRNGNEKEIDNSTGFYTHRTIIADTEEQATQQAQQAVFENWSEETEATHETKTLKLVVDSVTLLHWRHSWFRQIPNKGSIFFNEGTQQEAREIEYAVALRQKPSSKNSNADIELMHELYNQAMEYLEDGNFQNAIAISKTLQKYRWTGAFEIRAEAQKLMGHDQKAIATLQKGTKNAPDSWRLWETLGIHLSDSSRFNEALNAFNSGLSTTSPDEGSLILNKSITLDRMGNTLDAKTLIAPYLHGKKAHELNEDLRKAFIAQETALATS